MNKRESSTIKPKLWRGGKEASERCAEISIGGIKSKGLKNLLKYIRSNFERLSKRNIESLKEIILQIQKEILEIVKDNSCLGTEVKM